MLKDIEHINIKDHFINWSDPRIVREYNTLNKARLGLETYNNCVAVNSIHLKQPYNNCTDEINAIMKKEFYANNGNEDRNL